MMNILIISVAAVLLPVLLFYEKKGDRKGILSSKAVLSSLFVIAAMVQPHPTPVYYHFILPGLLLCLCGDVFLALPQDKMFLFGLIAFLTGQILYVLGFFSMIKTGQLAWIGFLIIFAISAGAYFRLTSYLGSMKVPVILYIIIISIMLAAAWSVMGNSSLTRSGRIMIFAGAFSFYFSDMFVARDRFFKKEFVNRLIGLPLYYTGQFLLALSVGFLN